MRRWIHIETLDDQTVVITHSLTGGRGEIRASGKQPGVVQAHVERLVTALEKIIALREGGKPAA